MINVLQRVLCRKVTSTLIFQRTQIWRWIARIIIHSEHARWTLIRALWLALRTAAYGYSIISGQLEKMDSRKIAKLILAVLSLLVRSLLFCLWYIRLEWERCCYSTPPLPTPHNYILVIKSTTNSIELSLSNLYI